MVEVLWIGPAIRPAPVRFTTWILKNQRVHAYRKGARKAIIPRRLRDEPANPILEGGPDMIETDDTTEQTLTRQLRRAIKDGVDYLGAMLALAQARAAEMALSSLVFAALLVFAGVFGLGAVIVLVVALGFWLTHVTGHVGWALLILGGVLAGIAAASIWRALRWLHQLKS